MNDWLQGKKKTNTTQHERAFIVLCIYAIVYVWIWRIWKYMLTNLYRVFYVMWNTWSRCSLLSFPLFISFSLWSSLFISPLFLLLLLLKTEHIRRTSLTLSTVFFLFFIWDSQDNVFMLETLDPVVDAGWVRSVEVVAEKRVVHSCWPNHWKGREVDNLRPLVNTCLKTQCRIS